MILWLETLAILALAVTAGYTGRKLAALPAPWWSLSYGIPLVLILAIAAGRRFAVVGMTPPVSWLLYGRLEFILMAAAIPLLVKSLLGRLGKSRLTIPLLILMYVAVGCYVMPAFLGPAVLQYQYRQMVNRYDRNGICHQQTAFTCGPAAAVTALNHLDLPAKEGELAILARTSNFSGTDDSVLTNALNRRYGKDGLRAELRYWHSLDELGQADGAIVDMKQTMWADHYVAVLSITKTDVIVGDPGMGLRVMPRAKFLEKARPIAIMLWRNAK